MQPPGAEYRYEEIAIRMLTRLRDEGTLTDVNPGSVTRTLVEAFALELAEAHARLAQIYAMGYIDTATGESLDFLVALLGQTRVDGLQVVGEAVFTRQEKVAGLVVIPEGTRLVVSLAERSASYRTTREALLQAGQNAVTVSIVADPAEGEDPSAHLLPEGAAWSVSQAAPLAGVGQVNIPRPTALRGRRESDDDLRARVKGLIDAAGGGTLKAMEAAVLATGYARSVTFRDANSPGDPKLLPGQLDVRVDGDLDLPEAAARIRDAINQTKGPGILVSLAGINTRTIAVTLKILPASPSLSAAKRQSLRRSIEQTVQAAIEELSVGESLLWNPVQARVLSLDGVRDVLEAKVTLDGSPVAGLPREIPQTGLSPMERIVVPKENPAVTVLLAGEGMTQVQLFASVSPPPAVRGAIARAVEELLAARNDQAGVTSLAYEEVITAARGAPGGTALDGAGLAVQVVDLMGGGVAALLPGASFQIGPDDRFVPHPDGPVWGRLP